MEQSNSWKADWFSNSQEIPYIVLNLKVHYHIYKSQPPAPILSKINPVHAPPFHFLKTHLNIILPFMPGLSRWSLSFRFPHQNPVYTSPLPHTFCMSTQLVLLDLIIQIIMCEEYRSLSSLLCIFLNFPITSSLLGPNILLSTLFTNTLSLHYSLSMSDHVSNPYKTTGKIMSLCILIFIFFGSKPENKRSCLE